MFKPSLAEADVRFGGMRTALLNVDEVMQRGDSTVLGIMRSAEEALVAATALMFTLRNIRDSAAKLNEAAARRKGPD